MMNEDVLSGKWRQLRGELKKWWGKLTDDDIQRIEGSKEKLTGILQERYGYSQQAAQQQVAEFLEKVETRLQDQPEK